MGEKLVIGYVVLFIFISIISFWCGREWERANQEDIKKQKPIHRIPKKWE